MFDEGNIMKNSRFFYTNVTDERRKSKRGEVTVINIAIFIVGPNNHGLII